MSKLSLLRLTDTRMMNSAAESDLLLDRLLSAHTLRVLRVSGTGSRAETIRARQEIFGKMDDPVFLSRMVVIRDALVHLAKQLELCRESHVAFEGIYLRIRAYSAYLDAVNAIAASDGTSALLCEVNAVLREDCPPSLRSAIAADLQRSDELLRRMESSLFLLTDSIDVADKAWLLSDQRVPSFGEQLTALAERMGVRLTATSRRPIRPDGIIGDAFAQLYHAELVELRRIIDRYAELDLTALLGLIDELRFFFEIRELMKKAAEQGLPVCLPTVSAEKRYRAEEVYDITLNLKDCPEIIPNDVDFFADAPLQFLIGANGGGKTTYLRAMGVNLLLFMAGCPIFAKSAEIYPFSAVYTHFPVDETFSGMGRLDSEKLRIDRILEEADCDAFLLLNETFSATDEEKGFRLAMETAARIRARGMCGLYVTHFLEVRFQGYPVLSAVVEGKGNHRTFKIRRWQGADSSYARDILRKYKLDAASLAERRRER
ncbi:MAG: hypothetical protein IJX76_02175 [Clostridia bacterium]|nr:hypothetical protein [Clostridia bacterium]